MAKHDIQKSRHLLKNLENEMIFLRSLMAQMESLSSQVQFVCAGVKNAWISIEKTYEDYIRDDERE